MEQIFSISQPWTLNGIWCDGEQSDRPAVVFLSSGLLRSQGPNRLYAECARELATQGISSLRFDLSGIGDSVERTNNSSIKAKTLAEVQEVFAAIQSQKGINRFILMGLCSGAHDGIEVALQDERVISVVSVDGYYVKTRWYKLHWAKRFLLPRLLQKTSWLKALRHLILNRKTDGSPHNIAADDLFFEVEEPAIVIKRFTDLLARKVNLYCIFTGGVIKEYSYQGQLADAHPDIANSQHMKEVYFPEMDHLLLLQQDRQKIIQSIVGHISTVQ